METVSMESEMKVPPPSYDESNAGLTAGGGQYPPLPEFSSAPNQTPTVNAQPPPQAHQEHHHHQLDEELSPYPQQAFCPVCKQSVLTDVKHVSGLFTWILVFLFILFGLFCGCCLLPLCIRSCKDVEHRCGQCRTYLGTYQRVFGTRRHTHQVPVVHV